MADLGPTKVYGDLQVTGGITGTVKGSADTATKLATARTINGVAFDGTANITVADATKEPAIAAGTMAQYLRGDKTWQDLPAAIRAAVLTGLSTATSTAVAAADTVLAAIGKLQAQITGLASSKLDASANAVSATKLATARSIGGVAFDGTADINLPGVNAAGSQSTSGNAATATKLATARTINGVAFDGTANIEIEGRMGTAVASAATITIGTAGLGESVHITGTTTITSLGVSTTGVTRRLIFDAALTLTHNATSLICPGASNIVTAAGTVVEVVCENGTSGYWRVASVVHPAVSYAELSFLDGVTSALQTQLNAKAALASPALTGTPTAPTAAVGTNTTQLATTAFVQAEIANDAPAKNGTGATGSWAISVTGNAATATQLATASTIGMTGDVTWTSAGFNGSANVTGVATLANSGVAAGTYGKVTVNAKGLVTAGEVLAAADIPALDTGKLTTGTLPIARGGTGGATAEAALTALGIGSMATRNVTISTDDPSGGVDGDVWFKV